MPEERKIRLGIVDDHQIIIDGLKLLLLSEPGIEVPLAVTSGSALKLLPPDILRTLDVLILDLNMPDISGSELAVWLTVHFPDVRILVLTMNTDIGIAFDILEQADISGFLPKSVSRNELITAVNTIADGAMYIHDDVAAELRKGRPDMAVRETLMLSTRELEIVRCIATGYSNREIGAQLFISENTVATHRKNIMRKANCHNAAALIELAARLGLLQA